MVSTSCKLIRSRIARSIRTKTDTILVFEQFTDRTNTTVTQVIDIVDLALTVFEIDQGLDDGENVFFGQRAMLNRSFFKRNVEAMIDFQTTDFGQDRRFRDRRTGA